MPAWSAASSPSSAGRDRRRSRWRRPAGRPCRRSAPCRRRAARPPRGRRSRRRRHRRPPDRAVAEDDVDLDRRVAARIEDLAGVDDLDRSCVAHARSLAWPRCLGVGRSRSTAMPGSSRPSRNSREAPPPVRDVGHLVGEAQLLDGGHGVAAADDDRRAGLGLVGQEARDRLRAVGERRDLEHAQRAVPEDGLGAARGPPRSLAATPRRCRRCATTPGSSRPARVLYSVPRVTSLATTTSAGRMTGTPLRLGRGQDPPRVLDPVGLREALADGLALGEQERVGHAAADDEDVDLGEEVLEDLDLVATPWRRRGPPRTGRAGFSRSCESISISRSISSPA